MAKDIDWGSLGFEYTATDYRYVSTWKDGKWDEGGLVTDPVVHISECAGVLQYSQSAFEGLKAYRTKDGRVVTFRPDLNAQRLHDSCERLCIPAVSEEKFLDALDQLVKANIDYVPPYGSGATLYIRPFIYGSGPVIGVAPAPEFEFRMICMPVGPYFKGGIKPIEITVSDFDRAAPHGTGHIKAGLNYAMSLYPKDGKIVTPKSDSILPSITRRSMTYIAEHYLGMEVETREVLLSEVPEFVECGLCGTAAVISPVGKINDHGKEICFASGMEEIGPVMKKLYDTLTGIQMGTVDAPEGWLHEIK